MERIMKKREMARLFVLGVLSLGLGSASTYAQGDSESFQPITAPIKNRGTYHIASGTWSRADSATSFSSDVIYRNSTAASFILDPGSADILIDSGRLPGPTSPITDTSVPGTRTAYTVDCFQLAYCTSVAAPEQISVRTTFYDEYRPCTDPAASSAELAASFVMNGLPAGSPTGGTNCWIVSFDLTGGSEFDMTSDGNGDFDQIGSMRPVRDSFGVAFEVLNASGLSQTVPIMTGECTGVVPGAGTAFGPPAASSTGLDSLDEVWAGMAAGGGSCITGNCPTGPYLGFMLTLFGNADPAPAPGSSFCTALPNATGMPALMNAFATDVNDDLILTASPVPTVIGVFFNGPTMVASPVPLGDGLRCAGGMIQRMGVVFTIRGDPRTASLPINYSAPYASSLVGERNFQYWFRSGLSSGTGSNVSDGYTITF